jgi:hypothetical protein
MGSCRPAATARPRSASRCRRWRRTAPSRGPGRSGSTGSAPMPIPAGPALSPVSMVGRHCRRGQIPHRLRYQSDPVRGKMSPHNGMAAARHDFRAPNEQTSVTQAGPASCNITWPTSLAPATTQEAEGADHPIALLHRQHKPSAPSTRALLTLLARPKWAND